MMGILVPILMVICAWAYLGRDLFLAALGIAALWAGAKIAERYFTREQRYSAGAMVGGVTLLLILLGSVAMLFGY